jgi:hypothetical protein
MSRADLELLHDTGAFNPSPRHQTLYATHVPFDTMTGGRGCEQALAAALRRHERVALLGTSAAGKSSVIAATLHPLVEDLVPLPVPVAVERPDVAGDPVAFVRHLVAAVSRLVQMSAPDRAGQARRIEQRPGRNSSGARRSAWPPGWSASRSGWPTSSTPLCRNPAPPAIRSWTRAGRSWSCSEVAG